MTFTTNNDDGNDNDTPVREAGWQWYAVQMMGGCAIVGAAYYLCVAFIFAMAWIARFVN